MKKILILTILITTYLQAEETENKQKTICSAWLSELLSKGIAPCKEGDILVSNRKPGTQWDIDRLLRVCKTGTANFSTGNCILEAQEKWGKEIDHEQYHMDLEKLRKAEEKAKKKKKKKR